MSLSVPKDSSRGILKMPKLWVKLEEFEENYEINNFSEIRSVKTKKILKQQENFGYRVIGLRLEKKTYYRRVHRLLARAFIPNSNKYKEINHINGIKSDNRLENLEWCSRQKNVIHSWKTGLKVKQLGQDVSNSKLKNHEVLEIKKLLKQRIKQKLIAKEFKVDPSLISHINRGYVWGHIK